MSSFLNPLAYFKIPAFIDNYQYIFSNELKSLIAPKASFMRNTRFSNNKIICQSNQKQMEHNHLLFNLSFLLTALCLHLSRILLNSTPKILFFYSSN